MDHDSLYELVAPQDLVEEGLGENRVKGLGSLFFVSQHWSYKGQEDSIIQA